MAHWDPDQYLKFTDARVRPALDLIAQIDLSEPQTIVDLGCGPGNVTQLLRQRWPKARIIGVDSSADMLAQARRALPDVEFSQIDFAVWRAQVPVQLIYSNAALHWLSGHEELLPRLASQLAPGGVLAVQMPRNFDAPSHRLVTETVLAGPWRPQLEGLLPANPAAAPERYYRVLEPHLQPLQVWETEYLQVLSGPDAVKEWVKGSWLRPLLEKLAASQRIEFEADYAARLRAVYPVLASGVTLYPFKRVFMVGTRRSRQSGA